MRIYEVTYPTGKRKFFTSIKRAAEAMECPYDAVQKNLSEYGKYKRNFHVVERIEIERSIA